MQIQINSISKLPFADAEGPWCIWQDKLAAAFASAELAAVRGTSGRSSAVQVKDGIATVDIQGVMSRAGGFYSGTATSDVAQQLEALGDNPEIKGVLLNINSPGGLFSGTKELADAVGTVAASKPVYAAITDVGASAAYWVASQAHKIVAAPDAMVGSIGTFTVVPDMSQMAENLGITVHVIRADGTGEFKGAGTPGAPVSEFQLSEIKKHVTSRNEFFIAGVKQGRGLNKTQLEQIADGRVFTADESVALGLVDEVATAGQAYSQLVLATSQSQGLVMETKAETAVKTIAEQVAEYQDAMPRVSADEVLGFLKSGTPLQEALQSHIASLTARCDQLEAELEASTAEPEPVKAEVKEEDLEDIRSILASRNGRTIEPVKVASQMVAVKSATSEWEAGLKRLRSEGLSRVEAVKALKNEFPELYQAYLAEVNG